MSYFEDFEEHRIGSLEESDLENVIFNTRKNTNKYKFQKLVDRWETREGIVVKLSDMSMSHLVNSKKMIDRVCNLEGWNQMSFIIYRNILKEIINRS